MNDNCLKCLAVERILKLTEAQVSRLLVFMESLGGESGVPVAEGEDPARTVADVT